MYDEYIFLILNNSKMHQAETKIDHILLFKSDFENLSPRSISIFYF